MLMAAGGCTKETAETKAVHHRERASAYFDKGEYREAIVELKNVVQIAPNDPDAHYRLALSYLKLGTVQDLRQSFKELSATVELNAGNQDAQLKLGQLLLLAKEPAKARAHADIVLTSAPDNKEGVILRGASLLNEGKIQEGIAELKRAIVLDPQNMNLYIDLARAYVHIKDYGSAESILQQALQANPQSLEARFALGDLHFINRKADLAEAEYKRALNDAPDRPEPRVKLAGFYASVNRLGDAEATYSAWVQSKPQDDAPLVALGDFYRATDQFDKAAATYQKALAVNPKSMAARDRQIAILIATLKLDEAERQTSAILQADSKDSSGRLFDAQLKLARGQIDNALPLLQALSGEEPRSPAPHHFLGVAYAKKGDLPQAVRELSEVLTLADRKSVV
jgi:tetratricopeptide (TPR) repeat protein